MIKWSPDQKQSTVKYYWEKVSFSPQKQLVVVVSFCRLMLSEALDPNYRSAGDFEHLFVQGFLRVFFTFRACAWCYRRCLVTKRSLMSLKLTKKAKTESSPFQKVKNVQGASNGVAFLNNNILTEPHFTYGYVTLQSSFTHKANKDQAASPILPFRVFRKTSPIQIGQVFGSTL